MYFYVRLSLVLFSLQLVLPQSSDNDLIFLKNELDKLKVETEKLKRNITTTKREMEHKDQVTKSLVSSMQNDMQYLHGSIQDLSRLCNENNETLSLKIRDVETSWASTLNTLQNSIKSLQQENNKRRLEKIAFTAENSHDMDDLHNDQTVMFDHVITNIGEGYNSNTGIFTASFSGVYVFFFNIRVSEGKYVCWVDLIKEGGKIATSFSMGWQTGITSNSNIAFVYLSSGNSVWLRNKTTMNYACGVDDLSSFSGAIVYPD